jgi:hypothetical protein
MSIFGGGFIDHRDSFNSPVTAFCSGSTDSIQDAEEFLSKLVTTKTIYARIDRVDGTVVFTQRRNPDEVVGEWTHSIRSLLDLITTTTHLITKEEMVNKITRVN